MPLVNVCSTQTSPSRGCGAGQRSLTVQAMSNILQIYFDGGCSPNPGNKYGSYEIVVNGDTVIKEIRVQFGRGTNNEAEFNALQDALQSSVQYCHNTGLFMSDTHVEIETDSKIVWFRLTKRNSIHKKAAWQSASERMHALAEDVLTHRHLFKSFVVKWKKREANLVRFGH